MEVTEIKEEEFNEKIKEGKVLIDCYADWCGPCKMLSPIIDEVAKERDDCKFYKLDVDNANSVASKYQIFSIPTLLLFKDGKLIKQEVGLRPKDAIINLIETE